MTVHITIPLDDEVLARARQEAEQQGISLELLVQHLISSNFAPVDRPLTGTVEDIFDLIPASAGPPTDIGRDKDAMIGEAVWQEHLRKTRQSP
ncbi:MAG: hypothetical protein ABL907_06625 [Hyphomicrobium sp.]